MEAPLKDYTKGHCPVYTNDYYDNFACRNAVPGNIACEGGVLPSEKSACTLHIAFNLLSALFGQHVINVWDVGARNKKTSKKMLQVQSLFKTGLANGGIASFQFYQRYLPFEFFI